MVLKCIIKLICFILIFLFYFLSNHALFSLMPPPNIKNQDFYHVINSQIYFSVDIQNEDIYPFPEQKQQQNKQLSTEQGPDDFENTSEKEQELKHEDQNQKDDSSQVVIDSDESLNYNSSEIFQCDSRQFPADSNNDDFQSYNICNQDASQDILSQENPIDITAQPANEELKTKTEKNDSKNVPKGMMKAFAHMVLDKKPQTVQIMKRYFELQGLNYQRYQQYVRKIRKSSKISIQDIRDMLLHDEFAATTRKLGIFFIRKRFISHIFNSKMRKRQIHMKYIPRWLKIFEDPKEFRSLK